MSQATWDFNNDGRSDLVVASRMQAPPPVNVLFVAGYLSVTADGGETLGFTGNPTGNGFGGSFAAVGVFNGVTEAVFRDPYSGTWAFEGAANVAPPKPSTILTTGASSLSYDLLGGADVDGDGQSELVFRDNATGEWGYMSVTVGGAEAWRQLGATSTAYTVIGMGDLNGDGRDDVAFRNTATGDWGYMSIVQASGGPVQQWHAIGPSSTAYTAVGIGDFNGDGVADVAFRNNATGDWGYMALNTSGAGQTWVAVGSSSTAYAAVGVGDYDGDGRADLAFQRPTSGALGYMSANPGGGETWHGVAGPASAITPVAAAHQASGPDAAFVRDASGELYMLTLSAYVAGQTQTTHWQDIGPTSLSYAPVGAADFNNDGVTDIAFRNSATGDLGYMSANPGGGVAWHAVGPTSTAYAAYGIGDFNGDGVQDILFRNDTTGDWGYMSINPAGGETWRAVGPSSPGYALIGIGNFDGHGVEIAFRSKTDGSWGYMSLDGSAGYAWHAVGATSLSYDVIGVGDFDRNGRDDILFAARGVGDAGHVGYLGYMEVAPAGGETWQETTIPAPVGSPMMGDFNGDGIPDLGYTSPGAPSAWAYSALGVVGQLPVIAPGAGYLFL